MIEEKEETPSETAFTTAVLSAQMQSPYEAFSTLHPAKWVLPSAATRMAPTLKLLYGAYAASLAAKTRSIQLSMSTAMTNGGSLLPPLHDHGMYGAPLLTFMLCSRKADSFEEQTVQFGLLLMHIVEQTGVDAHVQMAAALLFKNYVKREWPSEGDGTKIKEDERAIIRSRLIGLMLGTPLALQRQISEAIVVIAQVDFPSSWPTLIQQLRERLGPHNMSANQAVLTTLHCIFKRYRREFRSDELFTEINHVMEQFAPTLLDLYRAVGTMIETSSEMSKMLQVQLLLNKIFYSLCSQDLPAFFEDHLDEFMRFFTSQLTYHQRFPQVASTNDEEPGPAEKVAASVANIINLFAMRYEEDFAQLPQFVQLTWTVLTTITTLPKHDGIACASLRFISTVARQSRHKDMFSNVLQLICDKIIVPNLVLRESDLELFEDEPIEFVRRDIDGSIDEETRRGAAMALVRSLQEFYEAQITTILSSYVDQYLKDYASAPSAKWREKNMALRLFSSVAIKGSVAIHGVTKANPMVDIIEFFEKNILADLQPANVALHPVLKVDAIRFVLDFRNLLTKEHLQMAMPSLVHHLQSHHPIVHTFAALTIERILAIHRQGQLLFTAADLSTLSHPLASSILKLVLSKRSPEKVAENEYLMRALMRILIASDSSVITSDLVDQLIELVYIVSKNPSNPRFNHFLFESIAALIRSSPTTDMFEPKLVSTLLAILQHEQFDFIPYVFQIFAALLESRPLPGTPTHYHQILQSVLQPPLWTVPANVSALVRFLQAVATKDPALVLQRNLLPAYFGIFQTLIGSRVNDLYGFILLNTLVQAISTSNLEPFLVPSFLLILKRLQSLKTFKLAVGLLSVICNFVIVATVLQPASFLFRLFESLQPKLLVGLMRSVLLPELPKIGDRLEKRLCLVGLIKFVTDCPELLQSGDSDYSSLWAFMVGSIITALSALPAARQIGQDEPEEDVRMGADSDQTAITQGSSRLMVLAPMKRYPPLDVEPAFLLVTGLVSLTKRYPDGRIPALLSSTLHPSQQGILQQMLQQMNAAL